MARPARVLAIGWFGEGNLGDEAMLEGILRLLERAAGPVETTVATSDPTGTAARFGTPTIRRAAPAASGFRNRGLVRAALRADLVTLGGGDLIREQADGTVPALNWLSRLRVPLALHRRTALVGVSVGELVTPAVVDEVRRYLRRITLLAARDSVSRAALEELSGRPVHLMGDLALEALDAPPSIPAPHPVPRIGVATREIIGRGPSVATTAGDALRTQLAGALDRLVDETGARVDLVPFRTRPGRRHRDDDARAGEALAGLSRTGASWVRRDPPPDAAAFGAVAADLDVVLAVRLHGAILGAAAGRRVVGIAYDPKVSAFLEDLGLADQVLPLDASSADIAGAVRRALEDDGLEARVRAGVASARERTRALEPHLAALLGRR